MLIIPHGISAVPFYAVFRQQYIKTFSIIAFQPADLKAAEFPACCKINDNMLIFYAPALPVGFIGMIRHQERRMRFYR